MPREQVVKQVIGVPRATLVGVSLIASLALPRGHCMASSASAWVPAHVLSCDPGGFYRQVLGHSRVGRLPGADLRAWSFDVSMDGRVMVVSNDGLRVMEHGASGLRRITDDVSDSDPAISPEASAVAFTREGSLWLVSVRTGLQRRLTSTASPMDRVHHPVGDILPTWSPDGTRIAFTGAPYTGPPHIWVASRDGLYVRQLTTGRIGYHSPQWSPDGALIACIRNVRASPAMHDGDLQSGDVALIRPSDGHVVRRMRGVRALLHCSWSPDGRRIAIVSDRGSSQQVLLLARRSGGVFRRWTCHAAGYDARVVWRLTKEQRGGAHPIDETLSYDPVGNRVSKVDGTGTTTYQLNAANELVLTTPPTGAPTTSTWDAAGNLAVENTGGQLTTHTWDTDNRLTRIDKPDGTWETNTYRADGLRNSQEDTDGGCPASRSAPRSSPLRWSRCRS